MYVCLCVCVHIATHTMITDVVCDLQTPFLREAKVPHDGCGPLHLILPVHDSAVTRSSSGGRDGRKVCHRASSQPFLDGQKNSSRKRGCGRTSRRMRLAWIVEELFWAFKHLGSIFFQLLLLAGLSMRWSLCTWSFQECFTKVYIVLKQEFSHSTTPLTWTPKAEWNNDQTHSMLYVDLKVWR